MTNNLTYDDSLLESHYSKTCEASSYKEELSATSKPDSQINTTEELSACLARLNALDFTDGYKEAKIDPLRVPSISPEGLQWQNKVDEKPFRTAQIWHLEKLMELAAENIKQQWKQGNFKEAADGE